MLKPHRSAPEKPTILPVVKRPIAQVAQISDAAPQENKIRERAHQIYEDRGRGPGREKQDWAQAEHEILNRRP